MIFLNGLQRTGTNFAETFYQDAITWCNPYWKHDPKLEGIEPEGADKVICIIKNPYTWVESICFRNQVDIVKWFPSRHLRDNKHYLGPFNINLQRLLEVYYIFYTTWLNYEKTELVHYEDLLLRKNVGLVPMSHDWDPNRKKQYLKYEAPLIPQPAKDFISRYLKEDFFDKIRYPIK